jgi:hypothetical protein
VVVTRLEILTNVSEEFSEASDFVLLQMMFDYRHVKLLKTASNLIYEADQGLKIWRSDEEKRELCCGGEEQESIIGM